MGRSDDEVNKIVERYERKDITNINDAVELLSHREIQILKCLSQGLTTDEIVEKLILCKRVVEVARSSIMAKLGIKHIIILYALR
jgi:DNA-binding NarL/FixJ family response regulator